jgi:CSLREA domain-containing protein
MYTKYLKNKSRTSNRLILTALVYGGLLMMGLSPLPQPTELATGAIINVTITKDVRANDGKCSLREAVIAANTNLRSGSKPGECPAGKGDLMDSIVLASEAIYTLTLNSTSEDNARNGDLDIRNNPASTDLTIRVRLNGMAVIRQNAIVDDRVLDIFGAKVVIKGVMLAGGSNVESGGGIRNSGKLTLIASKVRGNSASWMGGGIFNSNKSVLKVVSSIISGNVSNDHGGGLVNNGGIMALISSRVSYNKAAWGGGIFTEGGKLTLNASTVSGNIADNDAGGIFIKNLAAVNIQNGSQITGNKAAWGGGVSSWGSALTIGASTVSGNTAVNGGGGLLIHDGGTAIIQNASLVSGNSSLNGGGIANWGPSELLVDSSTVSGNWTTGEAGGGLWNSGTLTVSGSTVIENSAISGGGGLFNWHGGIVTVDISTIAGNTAGAGGGIMNFPDGTLAVTGSVLRDNTASDNGDAVYSVTSTTNATSVTNNCIMGNGDTAFFNSQSVWQNATSNWWGAPSGPSGVGPGTGDSVSASIDFSGWLTAPPAICAP